MLERGRTLVGWLVPLVAIGIIVGGLATSPSQAKTDVERREAIAANVKCPQCEGASVADRTSEISRDLIVIIDELIVAGLSDDEIYDFFEARYGAQAILNPGLNARTLALWLLPALALLAGAAAVYTRLRRTPQTPEHAPTEPPREPAGEAT